VRQIAQRRRLPGPQGDGEPGAKALWLGLREINTFVRGVQFAREMGACV